MIYLPGGHYYLEPARLGLQPDKSGQESAGNQYPLIFFPSMKFIKALFTTRLPPGVG